MTIHDLAYLGNPVLRRRATEVERFSGGELRELAEAMIAVMLANQGVGLAAPQIGEGKRLIVFRLPLERLTEGDDAEAMPVQILVNPEMMPVGDAMEPGVEGCLSLPGLRGLVPRYSSIHYRGLDLAGRPVECTAQGFHARVVQHEIDHLDGIMYLDRMTDFTSLQHESEIRRRMLREAKGRGNGDKTQAE